MREISYSFFCLFIRFLFKNFISYWRIEEHTYKHYYGKYYQIEDNGAGKLAFFERRHIRRYSVRIDCRKNSKSATNYCKDGKNKAFENSKVLVLFHPHNKHRNVKCVDGYDRKLGGIKAENSKPMSARSKVCAVKVYKPNGAGKKSPNS